jgi:hypothetical protein
MKLTEKARLELLKWSKNLLYLKLYDLLIQGIDFLTKREEVKTGEVSEKFLLEEYEVLRR